VAFLLWYKSILGAVEGAEDIDIRQRVRILGPGKVFIGRKVRFGYEMSPSWARGQITIITKFRESKLNIGDECTINNNNSFVVVGEIVFGSRVKTGNDCEFYDSEMHSIDPVLRHSSGDHGGRRRNVGIGDNVMIGSHATIGPGTEVGANSVIGMRAHTRWKKFPENFVIVGDPARGIMPIAELLSRPQD
jgi:acetyltransferase-like isoleucine patch superfamily enzyme